MRNFLFIPTLFFIIACVSLAVAEENNLTPVEKYRKDTRYNVVMCGLKYEIDLLKGTNEATDCINQSKLTAKEDFAKSLATIKKPKAQEAIKEYQVAFICAMEGIYAGMDEIKIDYKRRQQSLIDKLTEAWARFEVEQ